MRSKHNVITDMLSEIHTICVKNGIKYVLSGELALLAQRNETEEAYELNSGQILMSAGDLRKFIRVCENGGLAEERVIEWPGNNADFPGMFVRYIDTATTYYTPRRLMAEKHLGMYITIQVPRPVYRPGRFQRAREQAWKNLRSGRPASGRKAEPLLRRYFAKQIEKKGEEKTAGKVMDGLLKEWSRHSSCAQYRLTEENQEKGRKEGGCYPSRFFEDPVLAEAGGTEVYLSRENEQLLRSLYGKQYSRRKTGGRKNRAEEFCDAGISYEQLDLHQYAGRIKEIYELQEKRERETDRYKTRKENIFNLFLRTYYRYLFGPELQERIGELRELYEKGKYEQFDEIVRPYLKALKTYKRIYISGSLTELIKARYGEKTDRLFKGTPPLYREGIRICDYEGRHIRTVGGENE